MPIDIERSSSVWKRFVLPALALLLMALTTGCLEPRMGFQGKLTDPDGVPVADGEYDMTVSFWTRDSGGDMVFEQTQTVTVEDGIFDVDITDFPPHIFSGEVLEAEDTLYMEVEIEGETLEPRRPVPGAAYAHGLVAGSGVVGPRQDADNVSDGGYDAAFVVVNNEAPNNNPGFGLKVRAASAGLHVDNLQGDGDLDEAESPENNPDIILGGEFLDEIDGTTGVDNGGAGVIASEPELSFSDLYLRSQDEIELFKGYNPGAVAEFLIYDGARFDSNLQLRLDQDGDLTVAGSVSGSGADLAERVAVEDPAVSYEVGDVLVISDEQDRAVELSESANSTGVIGVCSADPGFLAGAGPPGEQVEREREALQEAGIDPDDEQALASADLTQIETADGAINVAIAGIVPVKVSAENGSIQRGDLLTTSDTPGHAMKATDPQIGAIVGKAMGALEEGTGVIEMLVMLQ